jgi:predicted AlkP superfamily phosphohydrolase/phosphomutase
MIHSRRAGFCSVVFLALKNGGGVSGTFFKGVDWSRTRAYALGLSGVYLNLEGRESGGTVKRSEAGRLKRELIERISALRDGDAAPIRSVYDTAALYRGPYLDAAPDLIIGYADGYRAAWEAAVGKVGAEVIEENEKAWSGDHCVDPALVPGVLFSSGAMPAEDPGIEDLAPTALRLFGIEPPDWMEGRPLAG